MKFDTFVLDGDGLLYSVGYATQKNLYYVYLNTLDGDPIWVMSDKKRLNKLLKGMEDQVRIEKWIYVQPAMSGCVTIDRVIDKYKKMFETDKYEVWLSAPDNFRIAVSVTREYKGNRPPDKPFNFHALKEYLIHRHNAQIAVGEEADDMVSKRMYHSNGKMVGVTEDKDLLNTPGYLYRPSRDSKKDGELVLVKADEAMRHFYEQLLSGDTTDNIQGIPGIGPGKAPGILADCETVAEMECRVGLYYAIHYDDPEAVMTEMGRLVWMRRHDGELWCIGGKFETEKLQEQRGEVPELGSRKAKKYV